ncbi:MAG TPA: carboxypeptidase regulatory-like domain-containing protein [Candidatus Dormibacteraeota bacterium]|nr:carboxypeptidase regulatory-like domain-containing protein [Candidatus Dormibacteraeota bacterium]
MKQRSRRTFLGILLFLPVVGVVFWMTAVLTSNLPQSVAFAVNVHGLNSNGIDGNLRPAPLSLSVLAEARRDGGTAGPSASPAPSASPRPSPTPTHVVTSPPAPTPPPTLGPTPSLIPLPTPTLPVITPTPTIGSAIISGQVTDSQTHNAIVGGTVSLSPGGASALTDANGNFSFTVAAGTYTVSASAPLYSSATQTATVKGGQHLTLAIKLTSVGASGSLTGSVVDAVTQAPIIGATVSLSNGLLMVTDATGNFSFTVVPAGSYTITVSALGYLTQSQSVTVRPGHTTNVQIGLSH